MARLPQFQDYPSNDLLLRRPAPARIVTEGQRLFRTMIRRGAAEGPNFAGHFTIATWGCGSSCFSLVIVDAKTGQVYNSPFGIVGWAPGKYPDVSDDDFQMLSFQWNSRLLIVRGCPEDKDCGSYYYEWNAPTLKLLKKVAAIR